MRKRREKRLRGRSRKRKKRNEEGIRGRHHGCKVRQRKFESPINKFNALIFENPGAI
jgi:hypothetical protein